MRDGLQKRDQLIEVKSRGASDMHMKHFFKHAYETFFFKTCIYILFLNMNIICLNANVPLLFFLNMHIIIFLKMHVKRFFKHAYTLFF